MCRKKPADPAIVARLVTANPLHTADGGGTAKAIDYTLKRWQSLIRYASSGHLPIDNNLVENTIRPIALGKKNCLFTGSERAGKRAAAIQTLLGTAKLNGLNPAQWLAGTLEKLPTWPNSRIDELLPFAPEAIEGIIEGMWVGGGVDGYIDWTPIEKAIAEHYSPTFDAAGRPAYSGLLLFKMLLTGIWHGGLSDESVGDMAYTNLHVMRFWGLSLEDDVPDHSVLSCFRTRLTQAHAWDGLLEKINQQIQEHDIMVTLRAVMSTPVSRTARVNQRPGHRMKWLLTGKIVTMKKMRKQPCALLK